MRPHARWLQVGSSIRIVSRPKTSTCIFCQHRAYTSRLSSPSISISTPKENQTASAPQAKKNHRTFLTQTTVQNQASPQRDEIESKVAIEDGAVARAQRDDADAEDMEISIEEEEAREMERERRRQRRAEEKAAMREWQATVDVALEHVPKPRPATWDGMEMVGGETEFDTGLKYSGYLHPTKLETKPEITAALYRAAVEVFTTIAHDRDPNIAVTNSGPPSSDIYRLTENVRMALAVDSDSAAEAGALKLEYPSSETEALILASLEPTVNAPDPETDDLPFPFESPLAVFDSEEVLQQQIKAWGTEWHNISLENPAIKFAIVKRATRLLGFTIPDTAISSSATLGALLSAISRKPKPTKLHDILTASEAGLASIPNVTVHARRQTLVDKETAVGRWKIYRAALRARGLPVLSGVTGWEFESDETKAREMVQAEQDRLQEQKTREKMLSRRRTKASG